ncbi:MAG TPA: CAP domain-containing protein [Xanthobacteraceae bacterium]|nr:CAP domain-containing protein [Xanthobacteraceae bacterium]
MRSPTAVTLRSLAVSLCVLGLASCAADRAPPSGQPSFYRSLAEPGAELDAAAAASMISGYRQNNGLSTVTLDPELMRLANEQAHVMAARDKLDHSLSRPFRDRMKGSGFDAKVAAENISAGYHTLAEAFSGWRDSPPHRANMLLNGATRMGIAAVYSPKSKYKVFWSLILAAPDEKRG